MAEIGVEIHALDRSGRGIKQAEKSMGRLKTAVRGVTSVAKTAALGIGGIAIAGVGVGTALAAQFVNAGKELNRFSNRTGHTVEQLSAMSYAAQRVGLDLEDMIDVTEEMRIKANDVASGIETYATFFDELGINAEEYLKLSPDEQFNLTAESLKNVEDATRRTIIADELLSDTGKRLLQVTQSNADGFAGLAKQAEEAGRIMGQETVDEVTRLNASFNELKDKGLGLAMEGFEALAPVLADAADAAIAFVDNTLPKIIDWSTNVFDRFGAAKDRVGDVFDAFKNRGLLGAIQETLNPAKATVDSFNKSLDDTSAPITTVIEQLRSLQGIGADATYTPHPVLAGIQGDVAEIAAALDPGLKETLQSFSGSTGSQLTAPIQEIADTIPAVRKAFEDETPRLTATISGYTKAAGDIEDVGLTVGEVRDKTDLNVRAMSARLGPLGFPVVALWQGISDGFGKGRDDTVAEVVGMNTDLDLELGGSTATGGTLGGITIFAALASIAWGTVSGVFGDGRKDTVAEVTGMNTDIEPELTAAVDELGAAETLLAPAKGSFVLAWKNVRLDTVAELVGLNTDLGTEFWTMDTGLKIVTGLLTGNLDLVSDAFAGGRTDSVAEVAGMNKDLEVETGNTVQGLGLWGTMLESGWDGAVAEFADGNSRTIAETVAMNKDLEVQTGTTLSGLNFFASLLNLGWKSVSGEFQIGTDASVDEIIGFNTDLANETAATTQGLDLWATLGLLPGWQLVSGIFNTGRTDTVAEVQGMNTDLAVETATTNQGLDLWSVALGIGWWAISGEFNLGRTNVNTEMQGLNTDLETETTTTNTGLDLWKTVLNTAWKGLTGEFETGADDSIDEIARVGVSIGAETTVTAGGIDVWALAVHQRFQDFKRLIQVPIDAIVGVINRIGNAVSNALNALNNLRKQRAQGIPNPFASSGGGGGGFGGDRGTTASRAATASMVATAASMAAAFGKSGGGLAPGHNPFHYQLAEGGIVTQPTFALIGEAGPEAVIPLSGGGGPFGRNVVVNVYVGGSVVSEHELDNRITRSVNEAIRHEAI